jgi:hypothetical protein
MKNKPKIVKKDSSFSFLVNDQPFIMLAGEVHNSACTSYKYMANVWRKAKELNCNTILAPVYWELIESQENVFDFSIVEQLILGARKHKLKLVLLWFGSWKNGRSTYAPNWVKTNLAKFPRTEDEQGVKTKILSMFHTEILPVEINAFINFMKYIKNFDSNDQTVIGVQVENEVGVLDSTRDFSLSATEEYNKDVPHKLMEYIKNADNGLSKVTKNYESMSDKSWGNVFEKYADETFMCWHYALHIDKLAKAGKENYALPMFTNAWLKECDDEKPGFYPCGGPLPEMLDVWKCAAPNLEVLSPDMYTFKFEKVANAYARSDNPLFIPETRRDKWAVANLYVAIGTYNTLCYAPFGLESIGEDKSFITQITHTNTNDKNVSSERVKEYLSQSYNLFANMMPIITKYYGTDKMIGFVQNANYMTKHIKLGKYQIIIEFYHQINDDNEFIPGAGIIIQKSENELIFIGYGYRACLETLNINKQLDYLSLEKGVYDKNANWIKYMHLNGDEQHIQMEEKPTILKALYYEF